VTSFKESKNILKHSAFKDANVYSVARWQPKGYRYTELPFFFARDTDGNKLTMRGSRNPIYDYSSALLKYYATVRDDINEWIDDLDPFDADIICCWCPHATHSKNQMKIYNSFVCHTGLVARQVEKRRHDIDIYMDYDHCMHLESRMKPYTYKLLRIP